MTIYDFPEYSSFLVYRANYKTQYCKFGENCYHANEPENCFYAHFPNEKRSKTCIDWINNNCNKQNHCEYNHSDLSFLPNKLKDRIFDYLESRQNKISSKRKSRSRSPEPSSKRAKSRARSPDHTSRAKSRNYSKSTK
jgi:hypothetical protein